MARFLFDIETNGLLDELDRIHCLVLIDADTGAVHDFADQKGYVPIQLGLDMLRDADEIIGHNILGFDLPAIRKVHPGWWAKGKVTDTLVLTRLLFADIKDKDFRAREAAIKRGNEPRLPGNLIGLHGLKAWGFRLGFQKGDFHEDADWSRWTKEMHDYCIKDVQVNKKLYDMLTEKFELSEWATAIDIEMRFAHLIFLQEQHGFRFDEKAANELEGRIRIRKSEAERQLYELFDPWWVGTKIQTPKKTMTKFVEAPWGGCTRIVKKPTGDTYQHTFKTGRTVTRQVKVEVEQRGYWEHVEEGVKFQKVELRVFNPGSRQHIADRLKRLYGWEPEEFTQSGEPKIDDDILSALPYPPAQSLAEYFMLDKRLGQLADGKQAWLKQVRNGRIHGRVNTLGAVTGRCTHSHPNVGQVPSIENAKGKVPYGADCRALFLPDEGHVLLGCDAAGLELRCLAHFMKDGGRYAKIVLSGTKEEGTDIHTMNQKAAGLPTRSNAKTFIYAFLYGAGDQKIGSIVAPNAGAEEQRRVGRALKNKFLKNTPGLAGLIKAIKKAAVEKGWIRGIDGRRVSIRSSHAALNSLLQNAGAVAMKLAPVLLYERLVAEGYKWGEDFAQVAHVHDEMQITVRPEIAEYVGEVACWAIDEAGKQLGFLCPLAGEAEIGSSWKETH
jgi:DNA polymerase I-like protein with 3'-5' exonuclease and polymerase domains